MHFVSLTVSISVRKNVMDIRSNSSTTAIMGKLILGDPLQRQKAGSGGSQRILCLIGGVHRYRGRYLGRYIGRYINRVSVEYRPMFNRQSPLQPIDNKNERANLSFDFLLSQLSAPGSPRMWEARRRKMAVM